MMSCVLKNYKLDIKYIISLDKAPYNVISPFAFITITFMIIFCSTIDFSEAQFFGHNIDLSNNKKSFDPQVAASGNNVYVAWRDETTGNGDIYVKASTDAGFNFTTTEKISRDEGSSLRPQISAIGNKAYVAWTDSSSNNTEIFFQSSINNGENFYNTTNLSNDPILSYFPRMAVSGDNIYVVWNHGINLENQDIYFKRISEEYFKRNHIE